MPLCKLSPNNQKGSNCSLKMLQKMSWQWYKKVTMEENVVLPFCREYTSRCTSLRVPSTQQLRCGVSRELSNEL